MASDSAGSRPSYVMIIPNTKRHPNNTKTDQLPILGVVTGLPRPYHNNWPLCTITFFICIIEASKVDHSASYVVGWWWLLAAVFVSDAMALYLGAFEAGGTLSEYSRRQ